LGNITPAKYNQLYNRLDYLEKKIAIQDKVKTFRNQQRNTIDLPNALNEAVKRGLVTRNQIVGFPLNRQKHAQQNERVARRQLKPKPFC
jgi:hypothetical protein